MSGHHNPSLDELRRASEQSRANLSNTVVELRETVSSAGTDLKARLSPANLKAEVKDYVREGTEEFFESIGRKARENPLQTVAIGAGLAYPLWGLLKTIPMPIMLVGAGLWLSKQKTGLAGANVVEHLGAQAAEVSIDGISRAADAISVAGGALSAGASAVSDKVSSAASDLRETVAEATDAVVHSVSETVAEATNSVSNMVGAVANSATEISRQSQNTFLEIVDRNPLLVAGAGLALGAFIAAALPTTDAENQAFGGQSDDLKDKALDAVAHGVEHVKDVAAGMVGDVTSAAAREGLSGEGVSKTVGNLKEGVKSVVDRGLDTALGGQKFSQSTSSNHHLKS